MTNGKYVPKKRFKEFESDGEWEQKLLSELAEVEGGGTPSTVNPQYWDGDIDWYTPAEIGESVFVDQSKRKITVMGLDKSSAKILPIGTVLFTSRAGIGKTAILAREGCTNQGFQSIVPKEDLLASYFIYSQSNKLKQYGERIGSGSTFVEVSGKQMSEMPLIIPSIFEQKELGDFFQTIDSLISNHQHKLDKLKNLKKAYLSEMFPAEDERVPKRRFPGFEDEWEQRKVSDLFKITRGYVLAATKTESHKSDRLPYPVYSSQTKDKGLMGFYSEYLYEDAITWTTDGANAGEVNYRKGKFYCTNVCGVLLSKEVQADQMIAEAINNVAKKYVSYVGNPKLMNNVMAEIEIKIPSTSQERIKISQFFSAIDKQISLQQQKLDKLNDLKKAYLNELFV